MQEIHHFVTQESGNFSMETALLTKKDTRRLWEESAGEASDGMKHSSKLLDRFFSPISLLG